MHATKPWKIKILIFVTLTAIFYRDGHEINMRNSLFAIPKK